MLSRLTILAPIALTCPPPAEMPLLPYTASAETPQCTLGGTPQAAPTKDGKLISFQNNTHAPIRELYLWDAQKKPDNKDLLGSCMLAPGQRITIDLTPEEAKACTYNFTVVFTTLQKLSQTVDVCALGSADVEINEVQQAPQTTAT